MPITEAHSPLHCHRQSLDEVGGSCLLPCCPGHPATYIRRSLRSALVRGPRTPIVSTAIGEKRCSGVRLTYLATFLSSASAATVPSSLVAWAEYEGAKVSWQVTSQMRSFRSCSSKGPPLFHLDAFRPLGACQMPPNGMAPWLK